MTKKRVPKHGTKIETKNAAEQIRVTFEGKTSTFYLRKEDKFSDLLELVVHVWSIAEIKDKLYFADQVGISLAVK